MTLAASLGYPRFGAKRELKRALESYWSGKISERDLLDAGKQLRVAHWQLQQAARIDVIPSNDFSFYDQVLDTSLMVGAIPARNAHPDSTPLDTYFAMARGFQSGALDISALEMTKWFDTNYHYIVPEIEPGQAFHVASTKVIDEFLEAKQAGIHTRPVLLGPVSYLLLSKWMTADSPITDVGTPTTLTTTLTALPALLPVYSEILARLAAAGAHWVQIDEPCLVLDLDQAVHEAYTAAYAQLSRVKSIQIMLATYFGGLGDNLSLAVGLPVAGLHIDLVRAPEQLETVLAQLPADMMLSLGVIDGRNIWRTDLDSALRLIQRAAALIGTERLQIAPGCSLMFSPHDLELETELDAELHSWLAFARQKLDEVVLLKRALDEGLETVAERFALSRATLESRRYSPRTKNPQVRARIAEVDAAMLHRDSDYIVRRARQAQRFALPLLPTTTIGSFPQTAEVRAQRSAFNKGTVSPADYNAFLKSEIERTIRLQEEIGLDVLVHGEFERTDMVEYFGEQLTGIAFTQHGWVQSYGSRSVRPPILYGDVARPAPMTVDWSVYAQSLTDRPVKGMLTGPVTIMEWSFVRDDQPRAETCQQIALAIRDEVLDLEKAGIRIIQIDEPALREGLPLRRIAWAGAVDCFRLAASGVRDETQIHTHMCYAEFNDILEAIARMDADVISIEASRSKLELLETFQRYEYPNGIGPGVYDIHSPRIPTRQEIEALILRTVGVLSLESTLDQSRLWFENAPVGGSHLRARTDGQHGKARQGNPVRRVKSGQCSAGIAFRKCFGVHKHVSAREDHTNWEGEMKITEALEVEHELLRHMIEAMSQWLTESVAPDKLRERAVMLEIAIDDHAAREEEQLFAPLSACSNSARELVNLMEMVHTEARDLFDQVADPERDPKEQLWTILMLTSEHFTKEETGVFPMAERLLGAEFLEIQGSP